MFTDHNGKELPNSVVLAGKLCPHGSVICGLCVTLVCGHRVEIQPDGGEGTCACITLTEESEKLNAI